MRNVIIFFSDLCYKPHISTWQILKEKEDSKLKLNVVQSRSAYRFTIGFHVRVNGLIELIKTGHGLDQMLRRFLKKRMTLTTHLTSCNKS